MRQGGLVVIVDLGEDGLVCEVDPSVGRGVEASVFRADHDFFLLNWQGAIFVKNDDNRARLGEGLVSVAEGGGSAGGRHGLKYFLARVGG